MPSIKCGYIALGSRGKTGSWQTMWDRLHQTSHSLHYVESKSGNGAIRSVLRHALTTHPTSHMYVGLRRGYHSVYAGKQSEQDLKKRSCISFLERYLSRVALKNSRRETIIHYRNELISFSIGGSMYTSRSVPWRSEAAIFPSIFFIII